MKFIFIYVSILLLLFSNNTLTAQNQKQWYNEIGINILQLPATTIDIIYQTSNKPWYSIVANGGYTINYVNSFDIIGFLLSPHIKKSGDGYSIQKQSGGFVKIGAKFNLRKKIENDNYFFLGAYFTNSLVCEKGEYQNPDIQNSEIVDLNHTIYIYGFTGAIGFNFKIYKKLVSDFCFNVSLPSSQYKDFYGYIDYIPGMGFMEIKKSKNIIPFPMITWNLKYKF